MGRAVTLTYDGWRGYHTYSDLRERPFERAGAWRYRLQRARAKRRDARCKYREAE